VLRPREIALRLQQIAGHPYSRQPVQSEPEAPPIAEILALLRQRTGVDFTHYKQTTIQRRIHRRMALRNLQGLKDYLTLLRSDDAEVQALFQDFLIRVTQFFREP